MQQLESNLSAKHKKEIDELKEQYENKLIMKDAESKAIEDESKQKYMKSLRKFEKMVGKMQQEHANKVMDHKRAMSQLQSKCTDLQGAMYALEKANKAKIGEKDQQIQQVSITSARQTAASDEYVKRLHSTCTSLRASLRQVMIHTSRHSTCIA
jgi:hypothetical protein